MEYPLIIELNVTQDDFIEVEILEQELDAQLYKKSIKKTFVIETVVIAVIIAIMGVMVAKGSIMAAALAFPAFFWLMFLVHFVYNYKWGIQREFSMGVQHLLQNKDSMESLFCSRC